jgi:hypothetical protein
MPHIRDCILPTQIGIVAGSAALSGIAYWLRIRKTATLGLGEALGYGAIGGLAGLVGGITFCVMRHPANAQTGIMGTWGMRYLSFAGPALIEGAIVGGVTVFLVSWLVGRMSAPP